ncbi:MAG TPA: matrixin family metalloprotease, partial [Candidatus Bathyarchaeia archaeon]|nr:matrixin family metalloprotease [Candidatus Bathyarchaeia archaeon]
LTLYMGDHLVIQHNDKLLDTGGFLIEPLSENIVGVNLPWNLQKSGVMTVDIENSDVATQHQIAIIRDAILSSAITDKDGNIIHTSSQYGVYYKGWTGALAQTHDDQVKTFMPTKFNVMTSNTDQGDIVIKLINEKNDEGYMGYTKLTTDNDHITKATIMVFEIGTISDKDLSTVIRHEFGHALGLGHSTDSGDLMHDTIDTKYGYISSCDIHALSKLYEGQESSVVICDA